MHKIITSVIILSLAIYNTVISQSYASSLWLEDTDCKVMGAKNDKICAVNGSLFTSICSTQDKKVACSITTKDGFVYGHKPSDILHYNIVSDDEDVSVWISGCNMLILDKKSKKYYYATTVLANEGLLNKNCIGKVKVVDK